MGFTAMPEYGRRNAPRADRHSSVPVGERCSTWLLLISATQQEPSVRFAETDTGWKLADRHNSAPDAERCSTWRCEVFATQQDPSVGFTETEYG